MFGIDDALMIGAPLVGGLIGNLASSGDRQKAIDANQQALQQWLSINVPDPEQQKLYLQQYVQTGKLAPELEQAIQQSQSQMNNVQMDPAYKSAQLRALQSLQNLGENGGMTLADVAQNQKNLNDVNSQARGQNQALMSRFQQQGLGGSGLELANQLQNQQNATNNLANMTLGTQAQAQQRALQAIMGAGDLGGSLRSQDFGEQARIAQAQDAINQFNTRNLQSVQQRNADRANAAQQYNLELQQGLANRNTDLSNQQQYYNKNLAQRQYEDQLQRAQGASGQYNNLANTYNNQANQTSNMWSGLGSALSQGAGAYKYMNSRYPSSDASASSPSQGSPNLSTQISRYQIPQYNSQFLNDEEE